MNKYRVYKYTNIINNKVYIGITRLSEIDRSGLNGIKYKVCPAFWKGIQEFGWENFKLENLVLNVSKEEAEKYERFYIAKYKSNDPRYGYNIQPGGSHLYSNENSFFNKSHNDETKKAVAASNKKRIWTDEAKQAIRDKFDGKKNYGKPIKCVEKNIVYKTVVEASKDTGIGYTNITNAARDTNKTAGGFHWKYI